MIFVGTGKLAESTELKSEQAVCPNADTDSAHSAAPVHVIRRSLINERSVAVAPLNLTVIPEPPKSP
jgi:hypothetical protein